MGKYWNNLRYIMRHKYYVMKAAWKLSQYCPSRLLVWRGIIHDWSKFTPAEFGAYANHFFSNSKGAVAFADAWEHHLNVNKHHPEHWDDPDDMEVLDLFEMVCDWYGAGKAKNPNEPTDILEWYEKIINKFGFCEENKVFIKTVCIACEAVMEHKTVHFYIEEDGE